MSPPFQFSRSLVGTPRDLGVGLTQVSSRADLAAFLDVREADLIFYAVRSRKRYRSFKVRKRKGGYRTLKEPVPGLKILQSKLLQAFGGLYNPPACVHGFVTGRSIATGAVKHEGARAVLTVDLEDFFGQINFGRVWGLLQSKPFSLPRAVATVMAQLCTDDNALPQGAPTSPILSNMIARGMDHRLERLATRRGVTYTRYADDLTFSSKSGIPEDWIGVAPQSKQIAIRGPLRQAVRDSGFIENSSKIRGAQWPHRRVVTGLVINERVNVPRRLVRQVRAMIHAWAKYGEDAAARAWNDPKDRHPTKTIPLFRQVVRGKIAFIGMIRGYDDHIYDRFYRQYCKLTGSQPTPIEHRSWNHIRRPGDAVWVVESDDAVGTGFYLADVGLITCAHVMGVNPVAFSPLRPSARFPVTVRAADDGLDVAILDLPSAAPFEFVGRYGHGVEIGDQLVIRGYPDYNPGSSLWVGECKVTGFRKYAGVRRFVTSLPISKGASGSPVCDQRGNVVGVAATNPNLYNSIIPIGEVWTLIGLAGLSL